MSQAQKRKQGPAHAPALPTVPLATRASALGDEIAAAPEAERRAAIEALRAALDRMIDERAQAIRDELFAQTGEAGVLQIGFIKKQMQKWGLCSCAAAAELDP
jgi:hypothetical protein